MKKLNCILLIDDSVGDNRFHQLLIEDMQIANTVKIAENGLEALNFLKDKNESIPELIFLDISMPKMNGWDFLKEFKKLKIRKDNKIVVVILATFANPDEINRAPEIDMISNFELKPLTKRKLNDILERYF